MVRIDHVKRYAYCLIVTVGQDPRVRRSIPSPPPSHGGAPWPELVIPAHKRTGFDSLALRVEEVKANPLVGLLPWYDAATAPLARWCGTTANPRDGDKIARTPDEFFARQWLLHHQRARANQMMASNGRCRQGSMVAAALFPFPTSLCSRRSSQL